MRIARTILALALSLVLAISLIGCTKTKLDTRVAATVNGVEILEADITKRIESFRNDPYFGYFDDAAWAKLLHSNDFTPETLREYVIRHHFGFFILLLQKAEEEGITPNKEMIDKEISDAKTSAANAGESFETYLSRFALSSEAAYRAVLEADSIKDEVVEKLIPKTPPQAEIDTYISENAADFAGRHIYLIAILVDEEDPEKSVEACREQAEKARQELMDGASFESVAGKYMEGSALGQLGGDLWWGADPYLPIEVQAALDALAINEISPVIVSYEEETDTGNSTNADSNDNANGKEGESKGKIVAFFIARYTEELILTEEELGEPVEISRVPASIVEHLTEEFVSMKAAEYQDQFFLDLANSEEIVINVMPSGLSYDVDMALALQDDGEEGGDGEDGKEPEWDNPFANDEVPDPVFADNGLGISDSLVGTGMEIKNGDIVEVHYVGYLADGTMFDNSIIRGSGPYKLTVGAGTVIQGWDLGLVGMKVGGHRMLVIPPSLAYGSVDYSGIPANSTLTFYIELVSVNGDSTGYPADRS